MKKLLPLFVAFSFLFVATAQVETPQPSPYAKLEQKVGLTDITIEYSRPGVKERTIFGDLVPYGELWRAGANKNTLITFSTDASIEEQNLKAGTYAIFVKPNKESWDVYFYKDTENWGTPKEWDDSKVVAKTTAKVFPVPFNVETFTIDLNSIKNDSASLEFIWEKTYAALTLTFPTDKAVVANIDKVLSGSDAVADDYYKSAVYFLGEGKDISKAQQWIDKAVALTKDKPKFWYIHQQALIHAKAGDKKGAIEAAKSSLKLAKDNNYAPYVKKNEDVLKAWGAL